MINRCVSGVVACLLLASPAIPQDLPPGVLLLSRVRRHIQQELERLTNISCVETVRREHQPANGKLRPLDTVRFEVLSTGTRELFASPGDRRFSEEHPIRLAGSGTISDGFFGPYLKTTVLNGNAGSKYLGEENVAGRHLARWDFRIPQMWSGQTIQLQSASGIVGLRGSFWADPETLDVVRLELNADDFPPTLPVSEAMWGVNYSRVVLDQGLDVLLPVSGEFRMVQFTGETSHNQIEFTHCRAFAADSKIRFDAPDAAAQTPTFGIAAVDDTLRPLPKGLTIAVRLRSRISAEMAVGSLIDGVVTGNVPTKGTTLIPDGSPVRGRIRRLEKYTEPVAHYVVALEFTEVEARGIRYRFYADLEKLDAAAGVARELEIVSQTSTGRQTKTSGLTLTIPELPGVATFFFRGGKLDLPLGFRTTWKTRPLTE